MLGKAGGEFTNGPAVIKVPDWVAGSLGMYYMYIADHHGVGIRLAYSHSLHGPWTVTPTPVVRLKKTRGIRDQIASPDIYIDHQLHKIYLTVHGDPVSKLYPNRSPLFSKVRMGGLSRK